MARLEFDVPVRLQEHIWFLQFNGLGLQQDLLLTVNGNESNLSASTEPAKDTDFIWRMAADEKIYHLDLSLIPKDLKQVVFSVRSRESSFVSWSMRNPGGPAYQTDGLTTERNKTTNVLEIIRLNNGTFELAARNQLPQSVQDIDKRVPGEIRDVHRAALNLRIAEGYSEIAAIVDTTASMRTLLKDGTVNKVAEAIRGISSSISPETFKLSFSGLNDSLEVWPTTDISGITMAQAAYFSNTFVHVPPLLELVPELLLTVEEKTLVFVITDSWFYISDRTLQLLEQKNCSLVILKLLNSELDDLQLNFSHPRVHVRNLVGVSATTAAVKILEAIA